MSKAIRLCPHAVVLPGNYRRYSEVSRQVLSVLERFTPLVEPISIDEAFLDVTASRRLMGDAVTIAGRIKRAIRHELGLTASVGVGPNKFLAKLASDLKKPDALVVIDEGNLRQTLDPLPVGRLWGVGPATARRLEGVGIRTIAQLRSCPRESLAMVLGQWTDHYLDLAAGRDDRPVTPDWRAKSIGQEHTFATDVADPAELRAVLLEQVEHVASRLRRGGLRARRVTLKLRYGDFRTVTRSRTEPEPTDVTQVLWQAASGLLDAWARSSAGPLRLIGVSASMMEPHQRQLGLFESAADLKARRLDRAVDDIARRFGPGALRRGR
jgi:DNA polymerase-4